MWSIHVTWMQNIVSFCIHVTWMQNIVSFIWQNIVSFIGLFCRRDIHVTHIRESIPPMIESRDTYTWVTSHTSTCIHESCHAYGWVTSHVWMSHVTHMNEPCHTYEWAMSHIWMSHVTHRYKSRPTQECATWHIQTSHVSNVHLSSWVMSHISTSPGQESVSIQKGGSSSAPPLPPALPRKSRSYPLRLAARGLCDMTRSYVWHDSFMFVWHESFIRVWHDSFLCVRSTHSYVWHDSFMCVWHDWFICATGLAHLWDITHSSVTWLIHVCDMTHSYVWHVSFMCMAWLIHMCDMIHSYM